MKKIIGTSLFLFAICLQAQQKSLVFKIQNGSLKIDGEISNLILPVRLKFKETDFKEKKLELYDVDNQILNLSGQTFGRDAGIKEADSGYYIFDLGKDLATSPGNFGIPEDNVKLRIGELSVVLNYSNNTNPPINNVGPKLSDEDYIAGYLYYDALKLQDVKTRVKTKIKILNYYKVREDNNPFLKKLLADASGFETKSTDQQVSVGAASAFASLGNTNVTSFASGLARFLVERTKAELNEAFFNKMKEQLHTVPELKTIFPKTASFLLVIESFSYASILQVLKEAFETDIQSLPMHLYGLKKLDASKCNTTKPCNCKAEENCKKSPAEPCDKCAHCRCEKRMTDMQKFFQSQAGLWIGLGMFSVKDALESSNPANLIQHIAKSAELQDIKTFSKIKGKNANYNIAASIELGNIISQSLMGAENGQVWIAPREMENLVKDESILKIYLGLLLAKCQSDSNKILFANASGTFLSFDSILTRSYHRFNSVKSDILDLLNSTYAAFNTANIAVKKLLFAAENLVEADPRAMYDYYQTFLGAVQPIMQSKLLDGITQRSDVREEFEKFEKFFQASLDMAYHLESKMFSAAMYDAVVLLSSSDAAVFDKPIAKSFIKYGMLISTVSSAQSSEAVKQALEATVLPVGSSSIKRKSAYSISINGYVGGFYGKAHSAVQDTFRNQTTTKLDTITRSASYRTFGVFAPVGLSFNQGSKSGWGWSITAQILDLGSLASFYLTNGDKAALPANFKVKLSDIVSPGAQFAINLPKMPISLHAGVAYLPALRSVSQFASENLSPIAWRWQIGATVDIPLYNLKVWDFKN